MREVGTQWMRKPPHELPQGDSVGRIAEQHRIWLRQWAYMRWYRLSGLTANISFDRGSRDAN